MITAIALDLGTTSIKAGLLDQHAALSHIVARPAPPVSVHEGRYESVALDYAEIVESLLRDSIAAAGACLALGLSSQRSSFLIWEANTGLPLTPLISWQDNRGAASVAALQRHAQTIRELTGLPLTPYYFAAKLRIVLQENPHWRARLERAELRVGTLDTFLIWRWSGGKHFVTDASMAARTQLLDIGQQQWSPQLCDFFGISAQMLPAISSSAGINLQLDNGLIVQASVADQSAALIASIGEDHNTALVNLGTGGFVVRHLPKILDQPNGYLHTLVYQDSAQDAHFAFEGTLNSIAAALANYPVHECRIEDLAADTTFCLAEPSGLGAPYFREDIGILYSQSVAHLQPRQIATLLLEAVIFRVARILEDMHHQSALECVYLSGGLSELACLQQGIALCVPFPVYRLLQHETSLQGAGLLASGLKLDYLRTTRQVLSNHQGEELREKYRLWKLWLDELLKT